MLPSAAITLFARFPTPAWRGRNSVGMRPLIISPKRNRTTLSAMLLALQSIGVKRLDLIGFVGFDYAHDLLGIDNRIGVTDFGQRVMDRDRIDAGGGGSTTTSAISGRRLE